MKRLTCAQCKRPANACICGWIVPTTNACEVLILQHPLETNNAKGSAQLLALSLSRCRVLIGEQFEPRAIQTLLYSSWSDSNLDVHATPVLLYPDDTAWVNSASTTAASTTTASTTTASTTTPRTTPTRLIVLDATWRKSRKMLYINPVLAQLPRMALKNLAPSRYHARKAQRSEQRSTLEATCAALEALENTAVSHYEPLMTAFDHFVGSILARAESQIVTRPTPSLSCAKTSDR